MIDTMAVEFLDRNGAVLATGALASQIVSEGQHRQVQTFNMIAEVERKGLIDSFRFLWSATGEVAVSSRGTKMQGEVKAGVTAQPFDEDVIPTDPDVVLPMFLDRLNVDTGDRIRGVFRTLTIKEDHKA
jgi:hypothetical protein